MADTQGTTRHFVGSGKEKVFDNGGSVINFSIKKADLDACKLSEKGYYFLTISARKEADQYGNTHSVYENTFEKKETDSTPTTTELFG